MRRPVLSQGAEISVVCVVGASPFALGIGWAIAGHWWAGLLLWLAIVASCTGIWWWLSMMERLADWLAEPRRASERQRRDAFDLCMRVHDPAEHHEQQS